MGPFDPLVHHVSAGTHLYRVFSSRSDRLPTEFNLGMGEPTRFAFFRDAADEIVPGLDGVAWMSHRCNTDVAVVLFGDRVLFGDLEQDPDFARVFELGPDRDWLSSMCSTIHVTVRW